MEDINRGTLFPSISKLPSEIITIGNDFVFYYNTIIKNQTNKNALVDTFNFIKNKYKLPSYITTDFIDNETRVKDCIATLCISSYRPAYAGEIQEIILKHFS